MCYTSITYKLLLLIHYNNYYGLRIEELMQLLVCVVDAKLLERIRYEVLEPKDIEDANPVRHIDLVRAARCKMH